MVNGILVELLILTEVKVKVGKNILAPLHMFPSLNFIFLVSII